MNAFPALIRALRGATGLLVAASAAAASADTPADYDVLVRGARVLDGTGAPWYRADVGVRGDRIAAVGDLAGSTADEVVEADGLFLAPGFIDGHYHGWPAIGDPTLALAEPLLAQGVTTIFLNPDGEGPVDHAAQRLLVGEARPAVNTALLVPHGTLRREVVGLDDRRATPEELDAMRARARALFAEGAFGLSLGPFYTPAAYADTAELVALAEVAAEFGGFATSHVRDESDYGVGLVAAVEEMITIGREARLPVVVSHIKAMGRDVWPLGAEVIRRINAARDEGVEVWADHYTYVAGRTGLGSALLPASLRSGGDRATRARLEDPARREEILAAIAANLERRGGAHSLLLSTCELDPALAGLRLDEAAARLGVDPVEAARRLLAAGGGMVISFSMREEEVVAFMREPWVMTCSDGRLSAPGDDVPHPRSYGAYARKLGTYVRERGVLGWEQAIHSMTGLPARVFRVRERGRIAPGFHADLVLLDPATVGSPATFDDPARLATGVTGVWVNGVRAWRDGVPTGERPGRQLLHVPGPERTPADRGPDGTGSYRFRDPAMPGTPEQRVWYHRPAGAGADAPVVMVLHGVGRNADDYRDAWVAIADARGCVVIAPEYDRDAFPGSAAYNLGGLRPAGEPPTPAEATAFARLDRIFLDARARMGLRAPAFHLFGHSAGGQFVHRYVQYHATPFLVAAVAANAGWYTMPDRDAAFPYGLVDGPEPLAAATRFGRRMTILLGTADTDPNDSSLNRSPEAVAQGPHRFARGQAFFARARAAAEAAGVPFAWSLDTVDAVAHDNTRMAPKAAAILLGEP